MRLEKYKKIFDSPFSSFDGAEKVAPATPLRIFYSYAPSDTQQQIKLEKHLSAWGRRGIISSWYNRAILPGSDWKQEINEHLDTADIILLLISPDFMASDYCYGIEMQRALERHASKEAYVIAVIVRPVSWTGTPIEQLPVLPLNEKPITMWKPQDEGLRVTAEEIGQIIKDLLSRKLEAHGRASYLAGDYTDASHLFWSLRMLDPNNIIALNGLGFTSLYDDESSNRMRLPSSYRYHSTMRCFEDVLDLDPTNASAHYGLGCVFLELQHYGKALSDFEAALKINTNNADYHKGKSLALFYLNRPEEALSACNRALQLDQDNPVILNILGSIFDDLNRHGEALEVYKEALNAYDKALHIHPLNSGFHANKGNILHRLKRYDEALVAYDEAIKISPLLGDCYINKGNILQDLKRYDEALKVCEEALRIAPNNREDITFLRVAILIKLERSQEALDILDKMSSHVPQDIHFYGMKGHAFLALGAYDDALIAWDRVLHLDPGNIAAHEGKGNVFDRTGRYNEALDAYNEALRLDPSKTSIHKSKGDTLCRLKRYDEALAAYDEVIKFDPNDATAYSTKGLILNTLKRSREALTVLDEALRLEPQNADIRRQRDSVLRDLVNSGQTP
jgi:tetratricopeptide (TPR) repeat protein